MESLEQELLTAVAPLGISLHAGQLAQLQRYAEELERWNQHTNLTAISGFVAIYQRHFLDSLSLAPYLGEQPDSLIDIGSGAGFPGLPLKILRPAMQVTLADSVGKKTAFLRHVVATLGLQGVRVLTERAEELGRRAAERERYTLVTARAVAELRVLLEYGLPLVRVGGRMLAQKGAAITDEVAAAAYASGELGGGAPEVIAVQLPGLEPRTIVQVLKLRSTDPRYPRPSVCLRAGRCRLRSLLKLFPETVRIACGCGSSVLE